VQLLSGEGSISSGDVRLRSADGAASGGVRISSGLASSGSASAGGIRLSVGSSVADGADVDVRSGLVQPLLRATCCLRAASLLHPERWQAPSNYRAVVLPETMLAGWCLYWAALASCLAARCPCCAAAAAMRLWPAAT
jgi:hypothetical protein